MMEALCFGAALRLKELIGLKPEHVIITSEHDVFLNLPNKSYKAGNDKPPRVDKPVTEHRAIDALFIAMEDVPTGEYIFRPTLWNEKALREAVKEWASQHAIEFLDKGVDNVFIDGMHCLRHGGMALIKEKVLEAMGKMMKSELGTCSAKNVDNYARPNSKRGPKKRSRS